MIEKPYVPVFVTQVIMPVEFKERKGRHKWRDLIERGLEYDQLERENVGLKGKIIELNSLIGKQSAEIKRLQERLSFFSPIGAGLE